MDIIYCLFLATHERVNVFLTRNFCELHNNNPIYRYNTAFASHNDYNGLCAMKTDFIDLVT